MILFYLAYFELIDFASNFPHNVILGWENIYDSFLFLDWWLLLILIYFRIFVLIIF